jgi:hypothetical protein
VPAQVGILNDTASKETYPYFVRPEEMAYEFLANHFSFKNATKRSSADWRLPRSSGRRLLMQRRIVLRSLLERGEVGGEERSRERVSCVNVVVGGGNGFIWLRPENRVMVQWNRR